MTQSIQVRHNVEMGHRLSQQPDSKCFHLHGHSWWVDLEIWGPLTHDGMVHGIEFGRLKHMWRYYLDTQFDHHLCLNQADPIVGMITVSMHPHAESFTSDDDPQLVAARQLLQDWGITLINMDPTVENMAHLWGEHACHMLESGFGVKNPEVNIKVQEASTNAATWRSY